VDAIDLDINYYCMANPVIGKSLCSDWFFHGHDFAERTISMETVQSVYFCFGAKPANGVFNKTITFIIILFGLAGCEMIITDLVISSTPSKNIITVK